MVLVLARNMGEVDIWGHHSGRGLRSHPEGVWQMRQNIIAACFSVFVVVPVAFMLMDRDPPYIREYGEIIPFTRWQDDCGPPLDDEPKGTSPGACIGVKWSIRIIKNCPPSSARSITRSITDSEGVKWPLAAVPGHFGTTTTPLPGITRYFRIPSGAARGPAVYQSDAAFACNPLQHYLWPVIVDRPDVPFEIK